MKEKMYKITDIRNKLPVNQKRLDVGETIPKRSVPIKRIVVHCTDTDDNPGTDVYSVAKYDVNPNHISPKGCFTITYAYYIELVGKNIEIFRCLDHDVVSWHVGDWNTTSLGIVVNKRGGQLALSRRKVAVWLCSELCKELKLKATDVVFHRELQFTGWDWDSTKTKKLYRKSCPGWGWPDADQFRKEVQLQLNTPTVESSESNPT